MTDPDRPTNNSQSRIQTSIRVTTRSAVRTASSVVTTTSVHSTTSVHQTRFTSHSSHSASSVTTTMTEHELHSIQTELEDVEHLESTTRRTRASFNSIRDALGNIGARLSALGQNHRHSRGSSNADSNESTGDGGSVGRQQSLIQQLSERLHMVDMAHSTRVPLPILRRRSQPQLNALPDVVDETTSNNVVAAPIFHVSVRESFASSILEPHTEEGTSLPSTQSRIENRRNSLLFASRVSAHRLILEGSGRDLLASGGDTTSRDYIGISSFTSSGLASFTGRGSMRDLGRENSFFDLERHVHPSFSRLGALRESSGMSEDTEKSADEETMDVEEVKDQIIDKEMTEAYDSKSDSPALDIPTKKMKIDTEDEMVQPLITRRSSKSLMSVDSQHDSLPGSLYASPRKSFDTAKDSVHTIADENGSLYSWGWGKQSLHDDDDDRLPESIMGSEDKDIAEDILVSSRLSSKTVLAVSTGQHHSACATSQGTLYVVGTNLHGCVDPDLPEEIVVPKPVLLDTLGQIRVVQVSCGFDHTAILSSNGSVLTWGGNSHGQLGHRRNNTMKLIPGQGPTNVRAAGMVLGQGRRASAIACGNNFTMILTTRRSLLVCGAVTLAGHRDPNEFGSLKELPSLVGLPLVGISAGDSHAAVVTAHGTALM